MKNVFVLAAICVALTGCYKRDGHDSVSWYTGAENNINHVAYGSTDVRVFDMQSDGGHKCTVAVTDNNQGGIAMHCWGQ